MINIDPTLTPGKLRPAVERFFDLAGPKIDALSRSWNPEHGAPVFTVEGRYTARGWTDWTLGFMIGCAILQFEATGERSFIRLGSEQTVRRMTPHLTHTGVHDHGFNTISTHGNLLRLMEEGRIAYNPWRSAYHQLALKTSGAVQAARWTNLPEGLGYVYSFNGPHSLFSDTIRSLRSLETAYRLGHVLLGEQDRPISLLERALQHAETTARYNVYFGDGRDAYDVRGRVVHESIFNVNNGAYRNPSTQQGYSPFSTWTRGLAWIILGFAEQLEFVSSLPEDAFPCGPYASRAACLNRFRQVAMATADFYLSETPTDGVPYWDTDAPGLAAMGDYSNRPANPFNDYEPVDSSAAAIAAQGLMRLGTFLRSAGDEEAAGRYSLAGLKTAETLFQEPYLSSDPRHEGLLIHSVYHRPNGWDHVPQGHRIPCGESSMWGDYHAMELALLIQKQA